MKYHQCRLEKSVGANLIMTTTYLPERYAVLGEKVSLKQDDVWTTGWVVAKVGEGIDDPKLADSHKAIIRHRKETGDSLPK